jgi:hypothetical protein
VVEVPEGTDASTPMRSLIDGLPTDEEARARAAIVRSAAAAAARHVARATAAMSGQLAELVASIDEVDPSVPPTRGYTVLEEWAPTRAELVRLVESGRDAVDRAVRRDGIEELADRVELTLPRWEPGELAARLDDWSDACRTRFRNDARIRWRRAHAHALLDGVSWRVALNDGVSVPPRVRRIMRDRLRAASSDMHADVQRILEQAVASRLDDWRDAAAAMSAYTPGALLGAADDVAGRS